jgi:hypothetical protein
MRRTDLDAFAGCWTLSRQVLDRRAGWTARFEGSAVFSRAAAGLIYEEAGELRIPGAPPLRATRRHLWCEANGLIEVRFEDGRFFHAFDPRAPRAAAHHECPPDAYRVTYDFSAPQGWSSRWEIRGPRKDQIILSDYRR